MTQSAIPSIRFWENLSVRLTVSQMRSLAPVPALLIYYSFDLLGYQAEECVERWIAEFRTDWLRLAIVEALYQGRYKKVSIEQILTLWQRRGQPICHFNREFEQIVCSKLPEHLLPQQELIESEPSVKETVTQSDRLEPHSTAESPASVPTDEGDPDTSHSTATPPEATLPTSSPISPPEETPDPEPSSPKRSLPHLLETSHAIDQFSPPLPTSEFYLKLKAFAHQAGAD